MRKTKSSLRGNLEFPCPNGKIERFVEPCLLLLLAEKPAHGYELLENLGPFGIDPRCQDPGQIYRSLRRLEKEGLVESSWQPGDAGPVRRSYMITEDGLDILRAWIKTLEKRVMMIQGLLTRYRQKFKEEE